MRTKLKHCLPLSCILAAGLIMASSSWAQSPTNLPSDPGAPLQEVINVPTPIPQALSPDLADPVAPDTYILGSGDLVAVFVYQMPDLTRQVRVDVDGDIRLPLLPQPLPAAGKTAPSLAQAIRAAYVNAGLAHDPIVNVTVRQVGSKRVVVTGAVKTPVVLEAVQPVSLIEAISRAGGLNQQSGNTVVVTHHFPDGTMVAKKYNLDAAIRDGSPADNPLLHGQDDVHVEQAQLVYAIGALRKPGAFPLQTGEPVSVLKVVALAQGLDYPANSKNAVIIHTAADGKRTETKINLDSILKRNSPDLQLQAGDLLYVPMNGRQKVLNQALAVASQSLVVAIGYGRIL